MAHPEVFLILLLTVASVVLLGVGHRTVGAIGLIAALCLYFL